MPTTSPESLALSKALKRKGFVFVGPTTMYALMEAVGIVDTHLLGSHRRGSSGVWPALTTVASETAPGPAGHRGQTTMPRESGGSSVGRRGPLGAW